MVGKRIKELRNSANISQAALGKHLNVSQQAVANWEQGFAEPSIDILIKLVQYFNCTTDYLIGISANKFPENIDIGKKLQISDEAIKNLDSMARTVDTVGMLMLSDVLNALLEHPNFEKILYYIGEYVTITEQRAEKVLADLNLFEENKEKHSAVLLDIYLARIQNTFADLLYSLRETGIKTYLDFSENDKKIIIELREKKQNAYNKKTPLPTRAAHKP